MRLRRVHREDGVAMASTIGILGVVMLLVVATLSATISVTRQTGRDVRWNAALGAAEAGVQDFLFRINSDPTYWKRVPSGDPLAPNPNEDTANLAFSSFVPVSGATNAAAFTYSADDRVETEGRILLTATGVVGGTTRTIRVTIRRDTFLNYVYAADYGTLDPELYTTWPPNLFDGEAPPPAGDRDGETAVPDFAYGDAAVQTARAQCVFHRYDDDRPATSPAPWGDAPRTDRVWDGRHPSCHEFQFNGAIFNGPFHFNDIIPVRGGQSIWTQEATTSWNNGATPPQVPAPGYLDVQSRINGLAPGTGPVFSFYPPVGGVTSPRYKRPFEMPPNNRELRDTAELGGYRFTGPTRIVMTHNNEQDGSARIYVDSPGTGSRYGLSGGRGYLSLSPPFNGVVYVEDGPATACPANWRPPLGAGPDASIENYLTAMYPLNPLDHDITEYGCSDGDAYVEGELMGRMTIGTQHDIIVTWHIGYASIPSGSGDSGYGEPPPVPDTPRDMLGLIADGQIRALKPTRCLYRLPLSGGSLTGPCLHGRNIPFHSGPSGPRTIQDLTIYGALLTTQHSLSVDNATMGGSLGRLYVVGTLAEKFASYTGTPVYSNTTLGGGHQVPRFALGVYTCPENNAQGEPSLVVESSTRCRTLGGLVKQFIYDERVRYIEPPFFLSPDSTSWVQSEFEERSAPSTLPALP